MSELDGYEINRRILEWNQHILKSLSSHPCFEMMPGQEETNNTIISFRVKRADGAFLSHDELRTLYQTICRSEHELTGRKNILIGQPVKYGDRSFIRIALGASDVTRFVNDGLDLTADDELISRITGHVEELFWN